MKTSAEVMLKNKIIALKNEIENEAITIAKLHSQRNSKIEHRDWLCKLKRVQEDEIEETK